MKREFEMTQQQLAKLLDACKPVPYLIANGTGPSTPQENANRAWCALGDEMGFDGMTVEPSGKGDKVFMAEPKAVRSPIEVRTTSGHGADVFLSGQKIGFVLSRDKDGKFWTGFNKEGVRITVLADYDREQAAQVVYRHSLALEEVAAQEAGKAVHRYVFAFTLDRELTADEHGILLEALTEFAGDLPEQTSGKPFAVTDPALSLYNGCPHSCPEVG